MAKCLALCISLCLLVFFNACLARQQQSQSGQNECQLNRLQAREPDNLMESEAGLTESWDYNQNDFQCAGVAAMRRTIEPNGLHLPSYTNAPQLIYVVEGRGVLGVVFPGCPETFEESDQQSQQQQQYQQSRRQGRQQHGQSRFEEQDRHQRIRYVREGDVIALPAGVAYWSYNDGDQPLVAVAILDTSNDQNQLDQNPRRFYLAGNPQSEFDQQQQVQRQRQRHQSRQGQDQSQRQREQGRGQRGQSEDEQDREQRQREQRRQQQQHEGRKSSNNNNNIFSGFDTNLLAEALNVDEETVRRLQGQNDDDRNQIVRVRERLDFLSPLSERYGSREESEREQRQQERQEEEREQEQRYQRGGQDNSLEVRGCRQRIRENIGDPSRADVFTPQGGRISTLNSENLPMLRWIRLSAERGFLYNNAIYSPHWNLRAHEVYYVIRGNARVQVVNHNGEAILDDEVREGQLFIVPQNHAVLQKASNEGYEFINFRTEDNAPINTLAGQTSALRALPDEVLSNAFQISREQAQNLKYNRQESALLSASSSRRREIMA